MELRAIPRRQLRAAAFTALLSPLLRVVPRLPVLIAGRGAWLGALPVLPALLLLGVLMDALTRAAAPGEGLAGLIRRALGPVFGRLFLLLWTAWLLVYAGFILRNGAVRLTAAVYQQSRPAPFILILWLLCFTASLGRLEAVVRAGTALRSLLAAVLVLTLALALSDLSPGELLPLSPADGPDILRSAAPMLAVGGAGAVFFFLEYRGEEDERGRGRFVLPAGALCLLAGLLCLESVGVFGPALASRLSYPYFTMMRDISVSGLAQRFEALVIALWVGADYMMCSLLLRCAHETLRPVFGLPASDGPPTLSLRRGRLLLWAEAAAALLAAWLMAPTPERYQLWSDTLIPSITGALVFGGFPLVWLTGKLRGLL